MFSGRPVRWSTGGHADGRLAIDPRRYVDAREGWAAELDGRCTVIRAGEDFLEIYTDPLGAYPVFDACTTGARWFSNNADALRRLRRACCRICWRFEPASGSWSSFTCSS